MANVEATSKEAEVQTGCTHVETTKESNLGDLTEVLDAATVIDRKAERALKLKSDLLLLPIMSLTYLVAYLVSHFLALSFRQLLTTPGPK